MNVQSARHFLRYDPSSSLSDEHHIARRQYYIGSSQNREATCKMCEPPSEEPSCSQIRPAFCLGWPHKIHKSKNLRLYMARGLLAHDVIPQHLYKINFFESVTKVRMTNINSEGDSFTNESNSRHVDSALSHIAVSVVASSWQSHYHMVKQPTIDNNQPESNNKKQEQAELHARFMQCSMWHDTASSLCRGQGSRRCR
jgi:hypothetical protein